MRECHITGHDTEELEETLPFPVSLQFPPSFPFTFLLSVSFVLIFILRFTCFPCDPLCFPMFFLVFLLSTVFLFCVSCVSMFVCSMCFLFSSLFRGRTQPLFCLLGCRVVMIGIPVDGAPFPFPLFPLSPFSCVVCRRTSRRRRCAQDRTCHFGLSVQAQVAP